MAGTERKWDLSVDVLAVGSGIGGLTAAIVAHDLGQQVAILEKSARLGGVSAYSGGEVFLPNNPLQAAAGISDSRAAGLAYLEFLAAGYADPELQANLLDVGQQVVRYLAERAGVRWKLIADFPDYHYPKAPGTLAAGRYLETELFDGASLGEWQKKTYLSPHMPNGITHDEMFAWGGLTATLKWDFKLLADRMRRDIRGFGPGLMGYLIKAAVIDRKLPTFAKTPLRELVCQDGRVIGARAERDGKDFMIEVRSGVVLAVGGYDWRPDVAKYFEHLPEWHSVCPPSVEGDALVIAGEIGAAVAAVPSYNLGLFFGYSIPGETHDGSPLWRPSWEGGYPHALWVNRAGQRFGDESFYRDYLPAARAWSGATQTQPNLPPFLIFDANFRRKYTLGPLLPGAELPASLVAVGGTPRELAIKLGINAEAFEATLARFNRFAADGVDPDFGRGSYPWAAVMTGDRAYKNPNLAPLDTAPYYGLPLHVTSVGINAAGLLTNRHAQVMHVRGAPIPGLFATGNCTAQLEIGAGYQSGLANLRGMVGGYLAAHRAASA